MSLKSYNRLTKIKSIKSMIIVTLTSEVSRLLNVIKSNTSIIIVALTSRVSRPLSVSNYECNVCFLRYDNLKKTMQV